MNMKSGNSFFSIAILALSLSAQASGSNSLLPALHKIESYTFNNTYSCGGNYETSALFLSETSKQRNSPDLLFNGACGTVPYIEASTAGDDFSLISDLGNIPLEGVSASKAFNTARVAGLDNTFKKTMPVQPGHTYAVLIAKRVVRALYVLRVDQITEGQMKIRYAIKSYAIQTTKAEGPGFDWERGNY